MQRLTIVRLWLDDRGRLGKLGLDQLTLLLAGVYLLIGNLVRELGSYGRSYQLAVGHSLLLVVMGRSFHKILRARTMLMQVDSFLLSLDHVGEIGMR